MPASTNTTSASSKSEGFACIGAGNTRRKNACLEQNRLRKELVHQVFEARHIDLRDPVLRLERRVEKTERLQVLCGAGAVAIVHECCGVVDVDVVIPHSPGD